jgi:hypothetical protein
MGRWHGRGGLPHRGSLGAGLRASLSKLLIRGVLPSATAVGTLNWFLRLAGSFSVPVLRLVAGVSAAVAVGLLAHMAVDKLSEPRGEPDRLAKDVVDMARALHLDHRYRAVIDYRTWASRLLQRLGQPQARAELGEMALHASRVEGDQMAQASILIDDLGYNLFLMGPIERAVANIEDGMVLLDSLLPDPEALVEPDPLCVVLLVKARRHLAAIKADTRDFAGARSVLQAAIIDAQALSTPWRQIALAKLQYAAAYILDKELTARVSTNGQLALDGPTIRKLEDAIGGCREAIIVFRAAANLDWEARTASLLPELLRRSAPGWKVREAEEQAKAIRQQQACYRKTLQD